MDENKAQSMDQEVMENYSRKKAMKNTTKKRLERKGWKVGTVAQLLHLSTKESAYIEISFRKGARPSPDSTRPPRSVILRDYSTSNAAGS
jgi:hypothetical protein